MRHVNKHWFRLVLAFIGLGGLVLPIHALAICQKPIYLTFDTGHMEVAPLIAQVLQRQQVKVTFFAANEPTRVGGGSLGEHWAPWWRARAQEGHEFASHTLDHVYWKADVAGAQNRFLIRSSFGANKAQDQVWSAEQYCKQIAAASIRLQNITGKAPLPMFRAPGGKTSAALLSAARSCGFEHVAWSPSGFLGDELPSEKFSNAYLLNKALRDIRSTDILLAHLGIWSRKDPWAPVVLEPLIMGLKERGFCFQTLREHPQYKAWVQAHEK
jgi:peptidoglycan/xylan/chitin deacetylase (PgdA/CDA1 family)